MEELSGLFRECLRRGWQLGIHAWAPRHEDEGPHDAEHPIYSAEVSTLAVYSDDFKRWVLLGLDDEGPANTKLTVSAREGDDLMEVCRDAVADARRTIDSWSTHPDELNVELFSEILSREYSSGVLRESEPS